MPDENAEIGSSIERELEYCARCEKDHGTVVFRPFSNPIETGLYTHFWNCPNTREPVLLRCVDKDEMCEWNFEVTVDGTDFYTSSCNYDGQADKGCLEEWPFCVGCGRPITVPKSEWQEFQFEHGKGDLLKHPSLDAFGYVIRPDRTNGEYYLVYTPVGNVRDEWDRTVHYVDGDYENLGSFAPNEKFFDEFEEECNGSLMYGPGGRIYFDPMCRQSNIEPMRTVELFLDDGSRYRAAGARATGIVLSVSELEPIFCEEE